MPIATLTSKGQITLPISVRTALGLSAGHQVDFVPRGDGFILVPVLGDVTSLKGRFAGRVKKPVSVEAMDQAIAKATGSRNKKPS